LSLSIKRVSPRKAGMATNDSCKALGKGKGWGMKKITANPKGGMKDLT